MFFILINPIMTSLSESVGWIHHKPHFVCVTVCLRHSVYFYINVDGLQSLILQESRMTQRTMHLMHSCVCANVGMLLYTNICRHSYPLISEFWFHLQSHRIQTIFHHCLLIRISSEWRTTCLTYGFLISSNIFSAANRKQNKIQSSVDIPSK